jgi:hypothetical protein
LSTRVSDDRYFRSLTGATATGAGEVWAPRHKLQDWMLAQAEITGTATVVVEGRTADDLSWQTIFTFTASGAERISAFPQVRMRVSVYVAGTVNGDFYG